MSRKITVGLIQAATPYEEGWSIEKTKQVALERHLPLIEEAGKRGVQILGLQEIFNGLYFCPGQDPKGSTRPPAWPWRQWTSSSISGEARRIS